MGLVCNFVCYDDMFVLLCCVWGGNWQWDGEVSIWDSRTARTLSQGGAGEQMERNGDAQEMP